MSINGVFRTSVSGMNAQANRLSAVSDNIANSSTTGYKRSEIEFSTMVLNGSGQDYQSGSVQAQTRTAVSVQGSAMTTSSSTDLAIQGNGMFVVQDQNGGQYYTRAGAFVQRYDPDAQATYLVNSAGYRLTGQNLETGAVEQVNLPVGKIMEPKATTALTISDLQFPLSSNVPATAFDPAAPNNPATYNFKSSVAVYDGVGSKSNVDMFAVKTGDNAWTLNFSHTDDTGATTVLGTQNVAFNPATGKPDPAPGPYTFTGVLPGRAGEAMTVNFGNVTEYDASFTANIERDGNPASAVTDFRVTDDGTISALLQSGDTIDVYQAQMANFKSPDRLELLSGNVFRTTKDSGEAQIGFAGDNGFGSIQSGALEQSNVDLAQELTTMIESQRSYSANSKTFQTGSEMLELLVNLKR
ncbi:flagellar hook protein FlgE [Fulvimarina sp. MAC3]|uniref:flagellar hook protein FlgE n=1 Tax=Fulvimarina sp. MAC3 TaxID=3148887 RepID=UPI0031FC0481